MKMPTKKQILEAAEICSNTKEVLTKLFPEVFENEWIDITLETKGGIEESLVSPGMSLFCVRHNGKAILESRKKECTSADYQIGIMTFGDIKLDIGPDGYFRILKKEKP